MNNIETMKLALEALEFNVGEIGFTEVEKKALTALRQAIEQAQQAEPWEKFCDSNCVWTDHHPDCKLAQQAEPVAWRAWVPKFPQGTGNDWVYVTNPIMKDKIHNQPLYTSPPPRQPLTDEEERKAFEDYAVRTICNPVELQRERLGGYSSQELNYLWRGWKARAAHGIKGEA